MVRVSIWLVLEPLHACMDANLSESCKRQHNDEMNRIKPSRALRLAIVGGGYSGCTAAVQFAAAHTTPIDIAIVEPRPELGYGLAYSTSDPDHRLNGSPDVHMIHPADPDSLLRWCHEQDIPTTDPEARAPDGTLFIRRSDFGRYVNDMLLDQADRLTDGSRVRHLRDRACDASPLTAGFRVQMASGLAHDCDMVVVATGNAVPRLPVALGTTLHHHPHVIASAHDVARLRSIPTDARVLVLGTGLTALDVLSTLCKAGHRGPMVSLSRRGLRPVPYRPKGLPGDASLPPVLERIEGAVAPFIAALHPLSLRNLVRALRRQIKHDASQGRPWYVAFDQMRDVVWQFWPKMPAVDKRRFARSLRTWYDVHRFRAPPQNDALVRAAERAGRIVFSAAHVRAAAWSGGAAPILVTLQDRKSALERVEAFDAVVNCTGLDAAAGAAANPFLAALLRRGLLTLDASGVGFAVDSECRAIDDHGKVCDALRVIGPPTAGVYGDPLGALFIAAQVRRMLPGALGALERSCSLAPWHDARE
jgi:uncharacterized NAD(P)/FAD-binding protein YdhS